MVYKSVLKNLLICLLFFGKTDAQTQAMSIPNVATLSTQRGFPGALITTLGFDSANDRNILRWYWSDTSTLTADSRYVYSVTGVTTGRWIRATNIYGAIKKNISLFSGSNPVGPVLIDVTGPAFLGKLRITKIDAYLKSKTGTQIIAGAFSVGTNATAYNNLAGGLVLNVSGVIGGIIPLTLNSTMTLVDAGTSIYVNITGLPTGITAGAIDIYIDGYYTNN
jgi:hypothetical protein